MKNLNSVWQKTASDMSWNTLSNYLTLLRLFLSPIIVFLWYKNYWNIGFIVFFIAAITDFFDGYLARALNQQTHLGLLLDPVADKCLLLSVFGALTWMGMPFVHIPPWFFFILLGRELIMIVGALLLIRFCKRPHIEPMMVGKITTFLQLAYVIHIFTCYFLGYQPSWVDNEFLIVVAFVSMVSLGAYIYRVVKG